uniref:Rad60/SUMO-like domain-containing protein n=1 Tax=Ursus americanus TaxID=9643 RepID=A0A452SQ99_URSAM
MRRPCAHRTRRGLASHASQKPEGVKTENDHINLKVAGQDGSVVQFKIKRHTPLSKLMKAYCERQLEMEDEDTIDVFQQQTGGSRESGCL